MVTVAGIGNSGSAVQVATVVAAPTVTLNTANLANNAATLTITGTNFSTTAANDTVTFSGAGSTGITGSVTSATATSLTYAFTHDPTSTGVLNAVVTVAGIGNSGSAVQVATVVAAPTVTSSTANLANNAATLTINGTNFSTTAANDTLTFLRGRLDRHHRQRDFGHRNLADLHLHTRPHVERAS